MPVYLDNAATSYPKPPAVWEAMESALRDVGVGPGRGGYRRGIAANRIVFEAREAVATLLGVRDSSRIVITHSATEGLNLALLGLLKPGDHAVTTTMEHNSVVRPLHLLTTRGVEVTKVAADREGRVQAADIAAALRPETRLVAVSHCSNVTGTIQPVEEIGAAVRRHGALFVVDAAQSAGSIPISVDDLQADVLAAPGHKGLLGPQGTGILYLREGVEPEPLAVGGTGGFSEGAAQPASIPERYESGTMNTPGIAGLKAGAEFLLATGVGSVMRKEALLVERLLALLAEIPGVGIHGPRSGRRGAPVSFTVAGLDPSEIGFRLDHDYDISVRVGLHCAPDAHRTIGTFPTGTVRVSPGWFTTEGEIDLLAAALREIAAASAPA